MYTPDLDRAPAPSRRTLWKRRNVPYQLWRLAVISLRMTRVIFGRKE